MSQPVIIVRRTREDDWPEVRRQRLEMLADTPLAFGETLEAAQTLAESVWRERARRGESPTGTSLVAIDSANGDRWVGTMGGYVDHVSGPMLVGVYVSPAYRGSHSDATDRLLVGVEHWAREAHLRLAAAPANPMTSADSANSADSVTSAGGPRPSLLLHVHAQNARAIAAYERRGYVATGRTFPYILNPAEREKEMRKLL